MRNACITLAERMNRRKSAPITDVTDRMISRLQSVAGLRELYPAVSGCSFHRKGREGTQRHGGTERRRQFVADDARSARGFSVSLCLCVPNLFRAAGNSPIGEGVALHRHANQAR